MEDKIALYGENANAVFELYTIMVNTVYSQVLGGAIISIAPPGFAPVLTPLWTPMALMYHEFKIVCLSSV